MAYTIVPINSLKGTYSVDVQLANTTGATAWAPTGTSATLNQRFKLGNTAKAQIQSVTVNNIIEGTGRLDILAGKTLLFGSGATFVDFTGTIYASASTAVLTFNTANQPANQGVLSLDGATVNFNVANTVVNFQSVLLISTMSFSGQPVRIQSPVTLGGTSTSGAYYEIDVTANVNITFSGPLTSFAATAGRGFRKNGAGMVSFTSANNFLNTNFTVTASVLTMEADNCLGVATGALANKLIVNAGTAAWLRSCTVTARELYLIGNGDSGSGSFVGTKSVAQAASTTRSSSAWAGNIYVNGSTAIRSAANYGHDLTLGSSSIGANGLSPSATNTAATTVTLYPTVATSADTASASGAESRIKVNSTISGALLSLVADARFALTAATTAYRKGVVQLNSTNTHGGGTTVRKDTSVRLNAPDATSRCGTGLTLVESGGELVTEIAGSLKGKHTYGAGGLTLKAGSRLVIGAAPLA